MNYSIIRNILGKLMVLTAGLMLFPLLICIIYQEGLWNYLSFLIPMALLVIIGLLLNIKKAKNKKIAVREALIITALTWLIVAFFGCLPLIISGSYPNFFDAFFEMSSGFTTTGSCVLTGEETEALPHSLQLWRSFSHWVGGMGILVFVLAFIPESKEGSTMHILQAESPGPQVGKLVSKMQLSSRILYFIYLVLTIVLILLLWLGPDKKMNFFNSLVYSLGTAGTGGFSIHAAGVGYFSAYSQYVIAIFMIIFGINFSLFYLILIGQAKNALKNEELRWYFCIIALCVTVIVINIYSMYNSFEEAFRYSLFQVASIMSTTGYSTVDFNLWPSLAKSMLLLVMFTGGCAGSTAGGIKISRIILLTKSSSKKVKNMVSPRKVEAICMDGKPINEATIDGVQSFTIVYFIILVVCAILISVDNFDIVTNITASLACISNVGPGLSAVGPAGTYKGFSSFSKFILSLEMIAGRLELFPILVLFNPKTWKKRI